MQKVNAVCSQERNTFSIGLLIALSSWTLIFFTLLWGYAVYRFRSTTWLGDLITPDVFNLALMNTGLLVMSSWFLSLGISQKTKSPDRLTWASFGLGGMFLMGQVKLWQMLMMDGLVCTSSIAGSFFFLLTGFHAIHIIGGLIAILVLALRSQAGSFFALGAKRFWDFLLVVWLIMFVLIFVVK